MSKKQRQGLLPFRIELSKEPLVARSGLVVAYEMAKAMKLPEVRTSGLRIAVPWDPRTG